MKNKIITGVVALLTLFVAGVVYINHRVPSEPQCPDNPDPITNAICANLRTN